MMRRLARAVMLLVFAGQIAMAAGLAPGAKAPDFTLKDASGKAFKLSEKTVSQVTVLDFGRFTCQPCQTMMKELEKLHQHYAGQGVGIYSINLEGPAAVKTAAASAQKLGVTFPVLLDVSFRVRDAYRVTGIPHLVVIDTRGVVRFVHEGYAEEMPGRLTALIERYRPEPPRLPRLLVIQGAGCEGCGPMPGILKDLQTKLAGKATIDIVPYSAELLEQYKLDGSPALLFFSATGEEVSRHQGQLPRDAIVERLRQAGAAVE